MCVCVCVGFVMCGRVYVWVFNVCVCVYMCGYCNYMDVLVMCNMFTSTLRLLWLWFFRAFSSVVRQMPG